MRRTYSPARVAVLLGLAAAAGGCGVAAQDANRAAKSPATAKRTPATRVAAPAIPRVVAQPNAIEQMEQRYAPIFRQMYKGELYFLRSVCGPTKPEYDKIAADGEAAMKAALRAFAAAASRNATEAGDPRTPMTDALAKSVRANLSPEQAAKYQAELAARAEAHKRVVVSSLVAMTDRTLVLSTDQREKLAEVLRANWNEAWNHPQMLLYTTNRYFPVMPVAKIDPLLTEAQRDVWKDIPKGTVRFGLSLGMMEGVEIGEDAWDDDPPEKKKPDAPASGGGNP